MPDYRRQIAALKRQMCPLAPPADGPGLTPDLACDVALARVIRPALHDDTYVKDWLRLMYSRTSLRCRPVPLSALGQWRIDADTGNIAHASGRFFTVLGAKVRHRQRFDEIVWDQPFLDQPEVGILGLLATPIGGILHFCLQAKEEPGNLNGIQLSPTVQATYSNYTRTHGGQPPFLVDLFLNPPPERILFAKLQTEDGGRFLFKSNRNMIVLCDRDRMPDLPDHFIWLTLRQIGELMTHDNVVNACTRSILSCLL